MKFDLTLYYAVLLSLLIGVVNAGAALIIFINSIAPN